MRERHSLPWFRFRDSHGEVWTVALATKPFVNRTARFGFECVGLTHYQMRIVLVDAGQAREHQDETLLHEILHVSAHQARLPDEDEERAITAMSPRLWPLLKMLGFRWPRRPCGAAELERLARTYHEEDAA